MKRHIERRIAAVFCLSALFASCALAQTVRHVWTNSPFPGAPYNAWTNAAHSIQLAIDAAGAGETILVTNGVYFLAATIDFWAYNYAPRHNRTLRSVNGGDATVIDGQNTVECLRANSQHSKTNTIQGFTFRNGVRGVYLNYNSTLRDCIVENCISTGDGGGVYAVGGSLVEDCIIRNNRNGGGASGGGGIYASGSVVRRCTIENNTGAPNGGGIQGGTVYDCVFSGNSASWAGGAGWATLYDCIATNNIAQSGGGIGNCTATRCLVAFNRKSLSQDGYSAGASIGASFGAINTLDRCIIVFNAGTGVSSAGPGDEMRQCLVAGNHGPGIYGDNRLSVVNCTVARNYCSTAGRGAGIYRNAGTIAVTNSIVYFNMNSNNSNPNSSGVSIGWQNSCTILPAPAGGTGNTTNDPLFANTGISAYGTNWPGGDLRLTRNSPCLDMGIAMPWMSGTTDLDGGPRIRHKSVDMGAYELRVPRGSVFSAE